MQKKAKNKSMADSKAKRNKGRFKNKNNKNY